MKVITIVIETEEEELDGDKIKHGTILVLDDMGLTYEDIEVSIEEQW